MSVVGLILVTLFTGSLCLYILSALLKLLDTLWWTPSRIKNLMESQGIIGPSYRFPHGNNNQILQMKKEAMSKPWELSHDIHRKVEPHVSTWTKKYGKNYLNWAGPQARLVVTEPELIKEILNNKGKDFPKAEQEAFVKKILGDGIITSDVAKWAKLRKLAEHTFHGESLKGMIPAMIASSEMMLQRWKQFEGKEIEVFDEFRQMTAEVISRTAFGSSYMEGKTIFEKLNRFGYLISRNIYSYRLPGISKIFKTRDDIEAQELEKGINIAFIKMIKKREEEVAATNADNFGGDYLGLLLQAHHHADKTQTINLQDIIDECKTFYLAGQETTNTLLTWIILLLAIHTEWQEKARNEVFQFLGDKDPKPETISRLKIMTMIINESLRLYPPATRFLRKVGRETRLGKLVLPANLQLHIPALAVHHDPNIWGSDVNQFKPERFSEGVAKATNNNMAAFLAFGFGPRICVGSNFALTEAKIALSMILQRYSFTLSPTYSHSPFHLLSMRPQHGVQIILQPKDRLLLCLRLSLEW